MAGQSMTVEQAADALGTIAAFLRASLRQGTSPIGWAAKMSGGRYSYYISRKKLMEYVGGESDGQEGTESGRA